MSVRPTVLSMIFISFLKIVFLCRCESVNTDEFMSTYATDRPIQDVRQRDAPFIADDPSEASLEEVQQSDTPLATSTSSRTLIAETHVPSSSASVTPTKILNHPETLRPFAHLEARKEGSTKRKKGKSEIYTDTPVKKGRIKAKYKKEEETSH